MHTGYPPSAGLYRNAEPLHRHDVLSLSSWRGSTLLPSATEPTPEDTESHSHGGLTPPNSRRSTISNPLIDNVQQYLDRRSERSGTVLNALASEFVPHDTHTCARHELPAAHLLDPIPEALDD